MIEALLFQGLAHTSGLYIKRPAFLELEIVAKRSYGVFSLEYSEHYVFCMSGSQEKPTNSLAGLSVSVFPYASIDLLAVLMLGRLDLYSLVEKIPIWPN